MLILILFYSSSGIMEANKLIKLMIDKNNDEIYVFKCSLFD